jgi:mycofactocin precursor
MDHDDTLTDETLIIDTAVDAAVDEQGDTAGEAKGTETELVDELLIEEISIDGMCGVY